VIRKLKTKTKHTHIVEHDDGTVPDTWSVAGDDGDGADGDDGDDGDGQDDRPCFQAGRRRPGDFGRERRELRVVYARPGGSRANLSKPPPETVHYQGRTPELGPKQLGLLRELVPTAARIGLLINPSNMNAADVTKDLTAAGAALGVQIEVVQASNILEIDTAFASLVRKRADALVAGTDSFFFSRRQAQSEAALARKSAMPAPAETGTAARLETVAIQAADRTISLYDIYVIQEGRRTWIGSRRTLAQCQDAFEAHCGLKSRRK
jgi:hypothetical protein